MSTIYVNHFRLSMTGLGLKIAFGEADAPGSPPPDYPTAVLMDVADAVQLGRTLSSLGAAPPAPRADAANEVDSEPSRRAHRAAKEPVKTVAPGPKRRLRPT